MSPLPCLPDHERAVLRDYLTADADPVGDWFRIPPDLPDPAMPHHKLRTTILAGLINFSFSRRWAWTVLHEILIRLRERGEPVPAVLQTWAYGEATRRYRDENPPAKPRNPRYANKDPRDLRIMCVIQHLRARDGWTQDAAIAEVAVLLDRSDDTVRTVCHKMRHFGPWR